MEFSALSSAMDMIGCGGQTDSDHPGLTAEGRTARQGYAPHIEERGAGLSRNDYHIRGSRMAVIVGEGGGNEDQPRGGLARAPSSILEGEGVDGLRRGEGLSLDE